MNMPADLNPCCAKVDPTCVPTLEHVLPYPPWLAHFHCSSVSAGYWLQFTMTPNTNIIISIYTEKGFKKDTAHAKIMPWSCWWMLAIMFTFNPFCVEFPFKPKCLHIIFSKDQQCLYWCYIMIYSVENHFGNHIVNFKRITNILKLCEWSKTFHQTHSNTSQVKVMETTNQIHTHEFLITCSSSCLLVSGIKGICNEQRGSLQPL